MPDFALFKAPNYDYIQKTRKYEQKELYKLKERVVILSQKYFGCVGTIEELGEKGLKVKLSADPVKAEDKVEERICEAIQFRRTSLRSNTCSTSWTSPRTPCWPF